MVEVAFFLLEFLLAQLVERVFVLALALVLLALMCVCV